MTQHFKLTSTGIGSFIIGDKINVGKNAISLVEFHGTDETRPWFPDIFKYYIHPGNKIVLESVGPIDLFVIAVNKEGYIKGLFVLLPDKTGLLQPLLIKHFREPSISSSSSIEGRPTNEKLFWSSNTSKVYLTRYAGHGVVKLDIYQDDEGGKSPGIGYTPK